MVLGCGHWFRSDFGSRWNILRRASLRVVGSTSVVEPDAPALDETRQTALDALSPNTECASLVAPRTDCPFWRRRADGQATTRRIHRKRR
jgi:hypothetical protein